VGSIACYDKCLIKFGNYAENGGLMSKDIRELFLSPLTSIHVEKKKGNLLSDFPHTLKWCPNSV
jgi:hypothetical protein